MHILNLFEGVKGLQATKTRQQVFKTLSDDARVVHFLIRYFNGYKDSIFYRELILTN